MDNSLNCVNEPREEPPVSGSAPTLDDVIHSLRSVSDTTDLNGFVHIIKSVLEEVKSPQGSRSEIARENKGMWTSYVKTGGKFLEFVNTHTENIEDKNDLDSGKKSRVVAEILEQIGLLHGAYGGLAVIAYVTEKLDQVSANKAETLELLSNAVDLATNVVKLRDLMPEEEEKLNNAVMLLVQGCIICVSQIHSENISRFLKTSVNSKDLKEMSKSLDHLYRDLTLTISIANAMRMSELAKHQSLCITELQTKFERLDIAELKSRQIEIAEDQSKIAELLAEFRRGQIEMGELQAEFVNCQREMAECQFETANNESMRMAELQSEFERGHKEMAELQPKFEKLLEEFQWWQTEMAKHLLEIAKSQPRLLPVQKPEYPQAVGIDNAREEVIDLLKMTPPEDESALVVAIYGIGEIGKTTLDAYHYARVHLDGEERSYDLKKIQQVILKDQFPSFHSGASILLRDPQEGGVISRRPLSAQETNPCSCSLIMFQDRDI